MLSSSKSVFRQLFGGRHNPVSTLLPRKLSFFVNSTATLSKVSKETILNEMTLWAYISSTLTMERREIVLNMHEINGERVRKKKFSGRHIPIRITKFAHYCVICNQESIINFGELYLQRDHQIPGIQLCSKHNCFLEKVNLTNSSFSTYNLVAITPQLCNVNTPRFNTSELLLQITNRMISVANGEDISKCFNVEFLIEFGKSNKYILRKNWNYLKLNRDIHYFYQSVSEFQDFQFSDKKPLIPDYCWRGDNIKTSPFVYILMLLFIESKPKMDFEKERWKCLNRVCEHYDQLVPHKEEVVVKPTRFPMRLLKCECGMTTLVSLDSNGNVLKRSIRDRGHLWKKKLIEGIGQGLSQAKIGKQLGVDPVTVSYQANRLEIKHSWQTKRGEFNKIKASWRIDKRGDRSRWIEILKSPDFKGVSQARIGNWGLYARLKKHSLDWLKKINKTKYSVHVRPNFSRITDEQVSKLLLVSYEELMSKNVRNRLSKGFLMRYCGFSEAYITSAKGKKIFPASYKLLNDIYEPVEQYQIRRILMTYQKMEKDGEQITLTKLIVNSSINRRKASQKVLNYLESFF